MSNQVSYSLSVGIFGMDSGFIEIVNKLYSFTGFEKWIEIDTPFGCDGYTLVKAHGIAPWSDNLKWFCDLVQEKRYSADLYVSDSIGNFDVRIQWREGNCVYQKDSTLYYFDDVDGECDTIYYAEDDEEAIQYKHGEKVAPLEEYLKENYEVECEKLHSKLINELFKRVESGEASELEKVLAKGYKKPGDDDIDENEEENMSFTEFIEYQLHKEYAHNIDRSPNISLTSPKEPR